MTPRASSAVPVAMLALALAACGGEQYGDLRKELDALTKDVRGRVDPLPQVKSFEPVPYRGESSTPTYWS